MSAPTIPQDEANGDLPPSIPILGVVISETDYRILIAERLELAALRERVRALERLEQPHILDGPPR
jgi:hypothetical protein